MGKANREQPIVLSELLEELGYRYPEAQIRAMEVLIQAGLTTGRKKGIDPRKRPQVQELLKKKLVRQCVQCRKALVPGSVLVEHRSECDTCSGSPNRGAMNEAWQALRRAGFSRLLIVGGGPGVHSELRELQPNDIELRIIAGDSNENEKSGRGNVSWADLVVIWGGTILSHRVSKVYSEVPNHERGKIVSVQRRGLTAMARGIVDRCASIRDPRA
jgi:hypothetical protein